MDSQELLSRAANLAKGSAVYAYVAARWLEENKEEKN